MRPFHLNTSYHRWFDKDTAYDVDLMGGGNITSGSDDSVTVCRVAENTTVLADHTVVFAKNTTVFADHIAVFAENTTVFADHATVFAKNTTVFADHATVFAENTTVLAKLNTRMPMRLGVVHPAHSPPLIGRRARCATLYPFST